MVLMREAFAKPKNNLTLSQRQSRWPTPEGAINVATTSWGPPGWQDDIDKYNQHWVRRLTEDCALSVDRRSFVKSEIRHKFTRPLDDENEITYITWLAPGASYVAFVNVVMWGVLTNYRRNNMLPWSEWNPFMNSAIPTPWLRTSGWWFVGETDPKKFDTNTRETLDMVLVVYKHQRGNLSTLTKWLELLIRERQTINSASMQMALTLTRSCVFDPRLSDQGEGMPPPGLSSNDAPVVSQKVLMQDPEREKKLGVSKWPGNVVIDKATQKPVTRQPPRPKTQGSIPCMSRQNPLKCLLP